LAKPGWEEEHACRALGYVRVAGLDEVGRGCLAGPVVAAAVILNLDDIPSGLDDSKKLPEKTREKLDLVIREKALAFAIGVGEVHEIDEINIFNASKMAMLRALEALAPCADYLLIDGNFKIGSPLPQKAIVKGDQISVSIAAASILAKVFRDRLMRDLDAEYPGYLFAKHKGYGSVAHRQALEKIGPCAIHRKSFTWTPVRAMHPDSLSEAGALDT